MGFDYSGGLAFFNSLDCDVWVGRRGGGVKLVDHRKFFWNCLFPGFLVQGLCFLIMD